MSPHFQDSELMCFIRFIPLPSFFGSRFFRDICGFSRRQHSAGRMMRLGRHLIVGWLGWNLNSSAVPRSPTLLANAKKPWQRRNHVPNPARAHLFFSPGTNPCRSSGTLIRPESRSIRIQPYCWNTGRDRITRSHGDVPLTSPNSPNSESMPDTTLVPPWWNPPSPRRPCTRHSQYQPWRRRRLEKRETFFG